eukprot:102941-Alexandrium_andersonii.AAC.1
MLLQQQQHPLQPQHIQKQIDELRALLGQSSVAPVTPIGSAPTSAPTSAAASSPEPQQGHTPIAAVGSAAGETGEVAKDDLMGAERAGETE